MNSQQGTIIDVFNLFTGGALERFSLFALGVMPYISASIIMQLMSSAIPQLQQLKKEGSSGRQKITQYTRIFHRRTGGVSRQAVWPSRCSHNLR